MNSKKEEVVDLTLSDEEDIYSVASVRRLETRKRGATTFDLTLVSDEVQSR